MVNIHTNQGVIRSLLAQVQKLLDGVYPSSDAELDKGIQAFREQVLEQLHRYQDKPLDQTAQLVLEGFVHQLEAIAAEKDSMLSFDYNATSAALLPTMSSDSLHRPFFQMMAASNNYVGPNASFTFNASIPVAIHHHYTSILEPTAALLSRSSINFTINFIQLRETANRIREEAIKRSLLDKLLEWEITVTDYHGDVTDEFIPVKELIKQVKDFRNEVTFVINQLSQQNPTGSTQSKLSAILARLQAECTRIIDASDHRQEQEVQSYVPKMTKNIPYVEDRRQNYQQAETWQELCNLFKECYRKQAGITLLLNEKNELSLKDIEVDLELYASSKKNDSNNAISEKTPIEADSLFRLENINENSTSLINRIFIIGSAGTGKTTLCKHLAYRWATEENFWEKRFELVVYFSLQDIALYYEDTSNRHGHYSLENIILSEEAKGDWAKSAFFNQLGKFGKPLISQRHKQVLWEVLQDTTQNHKICFLLDGWNEVPSYHPAIKTLIEYVPCYILTSRLLAPSSNAESIVQNTGLKVDAVIENIGLNEKKRNLYIEKYFDLLNQPSQAQQLIRIISQNLQLQSLSQITLNCQLLCLAWSIPTNNVSNNQTSNSQPKNFNYTQLYDFIMLQWQRRATLEKDPNLPREKWQYQDDKSILREWEPYVHLLGELSFKLLCKSSSDVIPGNILRELIETKLQECGKDKADERENFINKLLKLGVIQPQKLSKIWYEDNYKFVHQTFMEYLAGDYLARGYAESEDTLIHKAAKQALFDYQFMSRFEMVWWFVAGRLAAKKQMGIKQFLYDLLSLHKNVLGTYQLRQWLICYNQASEYFIEDLNMYNEILSASRNLFKCIFLKSDKFSELFDIFIQLYLSNNLLAKKQIAELYELILDTLQEPNAAYKNQAILSLKQYVYNHRLESEQVRRTWQILFQLLQKRPTHIWIRMNVHHALSKINQDLTQEQKQEALLLSIKSLKNETKIGAVINLKELEPYLEEKLIWEGWENLSEIIKDTDNFTHYETIKILQKFSARLTKKQVPKAWKYLLKLLQAACDYNSCKHAFDILLALKSYLTKEQIQKAWLFLDQTLRGITEPHGIILWLDALQATKVDLNGESIHKIRADLLKLYSNSEGFIRIRLLGMLPTFEEYVDDSWKTFINQWRNAKDYASRVNILGILQTLVLPSLSGAKGRIDELWQLIMELFNKVTHDYSNLRLICESLQNILECLSKDQIKEIWSISINLLRDNGEYEFCKLILKILYTLRTHLSEEEINETWKMLVDLSSDSGKHYLHVEAFYMLTEYILHLPNSQLDSPLELASKLLVSNNANQQGQALDVLTKLASRLTKEQKTEPKQVEKMWPLLKKLIMDSDINICKKSLEILINNRALFAKEYAPGIWVLLSKLINQYDNVDIYRRILSIFSMIIVDLSEFHISTAWSELAQFLQNKDLLIRQNALVIFDRIIPQLEIEQIKTAAEKLSTVALSDEDFSIRWMAIKVVSKVMLALSEQEREELWSNYLRSILIDNNQEKISHFFSGLLNANSILIINNGSGHLKLQQMLIPFKLNVIQTKILLSACKEFQPPLFEESLQKLKQALEFNTFQLVQPQPNEDNNDKNASPIDVSLLSHQLSCTLKDNSNSTNKSIAISNTESSLNNYVPS